MGDYNIGMFRKVGETLSSEREQELSDKLSPILSKFEDKLGILLRKFEVDLDVEEKIYFKRNIIYSIIQDFGTWSEIGDCIPDYVKFGTDKVLLLTLEDFNTWIGRD